MFNRSIIQPLLVSWRPLWPIFFSPFRGSCCVKMAKNDWKSPLLPLFYLYIYSIYIYDWKPFLMYFNIRKMFSQSIVQPFHMSFQPMWPFFLPFQGVMLCKNVQKLLKLNISCTFRTVCDSKPFYVFSFIWNMFGQVVSQCFHLS